ncbi:transcriptional regulator family: Fungal Specific TF [Penicillium frequentans]|nr:transcriptional regulator family: Fungal Specific TF [Penicillium glabrum]
MDASLPSPPAVNALRESFGDRKPPDITRKITACVACRKQKIKCHMRDGQAPCTRCKKRGLPCTVNRSLQTLLEEDVTWKGAMVRKIRRLEEAIAQIADKVDIPELKTQPEEHPESLIPPVDLTNAESSTFSPESQHQTQAQVQAPSQPRDDRELPRTWEVVMDPRGGPASIPASCLSDSARNALPNGLPNTRRPDLISTGLITLRQALALFEEYHLRLDHFLYRILGDHISLDSVRVASPLLTAAVCTVGALHSQSLGNLFDICYNEFKSLVSTQLFSRTANEDDIRGLCIGAFWLHELSWALIGNAVRVASDIHLHSGIYKALKGDREGYLQVRLYYLVYVCDHHFSIAYGRPPMSHEGFIIKSASRMLQTEHATEDDARLISQVHEWSVLSQVFDTFGVDVDTAIAPQTIPQLRRYSIALDTWLADWNERFRENRNVGNYPQKGVGFHFHFAKLYLCSHAFRGMPAVENMTEWFTPELEEIANAGVLSAMSILRVIVSDAEFRSFMNGLPLYFDTMLAFAMVFLLKVATKYATVIRIDTVKILSLVAQTVAALREITRTMHRQHLLVVIAEGLGRLLSRCQVPPQTSTEALYHSAPMMDPNPQFDMGWMENMASFDFQTHFPDLDEWWLHYSTSMGPQVPRG